MTGSSSSRFTFVGNSASSARFLFRPSFIRREFRMLSRALSVASDVFVEVSPNVSRGRARLSETLLSPLTKSGSRVRLRRELCISSRKRRPTHSQGTPKRQRAPPQSPRSIRQCHYQRRPRQTMIPIRYAQFPPEPHARSAFCQRG